MFGLQNVSARDKFAPIERLTFGVTGSRLGVARPSIEAVQVGTRVILNRVGDAVRDPWEVLYVVGHPWFRCGSGYRRNSRGFLLVGMWPLVVA